MYTPVSFAETDIEKLHAFIERHSFAALVTHDARQSVASHLPLLLERNAQPYGRLIGHVARANSQWEHADGQPALVIFSGPHAYISPSWYEAANVVPTWNYVAVHVYGTMRLEHRHERLLEIVERFVEVYEAGMRQPWTVDSAEPVFIHKLVDATVGFTIDIEQIEGKWKLNQNHDATRRTKVIRALQEVGGENRERIAELMSQTLED